MKQNFLQVLQFFECNKKWEKVWVKLKMAQLHNKDRVEQEVERTLFPSQTTLGSQYLRASMWP